jgi:hypothetical protein
MTLPSASNLDVGHQRPLLREAIDLVRERMPQRRALAGLACLSLGALLGVLSYRAHAAPTFPGPLLRRLL